MLKISLKFSTLRFQINHWYDFFILVANGQFVLTLQVVLHKKWAFVAL